MWGLGILTFRDYGFLRLRVSFFTFGVRDSYVWGVVILLLGVRNSYVSGSVILTFEG